MNMRKKIFCEEKGGKKKEKAMKHKENERGKNKKNENSKFSMNIHESLNPQDYFKSSMLT